MTSALLVLRRPDAIFHPQLWAEDGVVWFADAYNHGALKALLFARDGYLQLFPRLVAAVSLWVPLLRVPIVFNLCALAVEAVPPLFLVSGRMRNVGPLPLRCVLALLTYLFPIPSRCTPLSRTHNRNWRCWHCWLSSRKRPAHDGARLSMLLC